MEFFTDTAEIEHVMNLLREEIRIGALGDITPLIDRIILSLQTHVKGFKNLEEYSLFMDCQSCSDVLHYSPYFKYDDTRAAADALCTLFFMKEDAKTENQDDLFSQVPELEQRLKSVLLYKFQGPSVAASILRSKRPPQSKKLEGVFAFACHCVDNIGFDVTPKRCWDSLGEDEEWRYRDKSGNEIAVWLNGNNICQSISGREPSEITKNSFRKYLTEARKILNIDKK
ncbi:hypothetical protein [uncultured Pseudodesulfovibrio sp.]|uniref:hypothetical protein n=1 Tax=uncultured Pseudodesulfovibrio sp. TaxID=2035858 RepID=UPI0029C82330|nr:hypothetical protein [uncultured Pseudodesulfovibrio sp.]